LANVLPSKRSFLATIGAGAKNKLVDGWIRKYDPNLDPDSFFPASSDTGIYEALIEHKESLGSHIRGTYFRDDNGTVVERLYPVPTEGLPGLMSSERRKMVVGMEAGELAVKNYLKINFVEAT
jgi:hypothetical protein